MVLSELEWYMQKKWSETTNLHHTLSKLKVDKRLKPQHHKNPRGKQRQGNFRYSCSNIFADISPRARKIKQKNKARWDYIKLKTSAWLKKTSK